MITDGIGLYIHVPFCRSKCRYCDFASFPGLSDTAREEYLSALVTEIKGYERKNKIRVNSVFFGGGTPSLLSASDMKRVLDAVRSTFEISLGSEITVEANPKTVDKNKLFEYRALGINRLSIGLQSIHENEQKLLGRIHNFDDFLDTYQAARAVGFGNISVDIMYAIPEQTEKSLGETLDAIIDLSPEHISAYGLIIEEGTPFFEMKDSRPLPNEDTELSMYRLIREKLSSAGYSHYEISNYAKAGFECRHNLKYWRDEEYIGVGLAAYSYFEGVRYGNVRDMRSYVENPTSARAETDEISADDEAYEYAMMHLRLSDGFSLSEYSSRFGEDFLGKRAEKIKRYSSLGLLKVERDRLFLTEDGFYLSNSIMADII